MFTNIITALLMVTIAQSQPAGPPAEKPDQPEKRESKQDSKQQKKESKTGKRQPAPPKNLAVKALDMVIPEAEFKDLTLEDFAEWLGRTTKANVVVRWKVLEKAGVARDAPVTLQEKNIKLRRLLPLVFAQVTEDLRSVELAAKADGNTLMISTKEDVNVELITKTYDVQDLLHSVPDFRAARPREIGGGPLLGDRVAWVEGGGEKERGDPVEQLIKTITTDIQPLSWKANGGKGTISYYKGRLIIRNNVEVHQQLGGFLSEPAEGGRG